MYTFAHVDLRISSESLWLVTVREDVTFGGKNACTRTRMYRMDGGTGIKPPKPTEGHLKDPEIWL